MKKEELSIKRMHMVRTQISWSLESFNNYRLDRRCGTDNEDKSDCTEGSEHVVEVISRKFSES